MTFAEWIKSRLEALQEMVGLGEDDSPGEDLLHKDSQHPVDRISLKFVSDPAKLNWVRKTLERFCEASGLEGAARDEVGLVINEALANVIRHAYHGATDKPVEVFAEQYNGGVRMVIRDWGNGFDPTKKMEAEEKDPLIPGGLGLLCMNRLMDSVKYIPQPDGMELELIRTTKESKCSGDCM